MSVDAIFTDAGCDHDALNSAVGVLRTQQAQPHRSMQHILWEAIKDYAERAAERRAATSPAGDLVERLEQLAEHLSPVSDLYGSEIATIREAAQALRYQSTGGTEITDDVRGLVTKLQALAEDDTSHYPATAKKLAAEAAATLTSLLERAERAERRAEELADGLMYVTVDHTGCIYTTADEDRAIRLAKVNLAAAIRGERAVRERAEARIKELEQALETAAVDLDEAAEEIEAWGAYASDYFQTKHDLDGCVKDVRDAALRARAVKGGEG